MDLILTPTTPNVAFPIGEKQTNPIEMYLNDVLTVPASLAGLPAISVSAGFNNEMLPIGLQVIGKPFDEISVLAAVANRKVKRVLMNTYSRGKTNGKLFWAWRFINRQVQNQSFFP